MFIPKHCLEDLSKYRWIYNEHKSEIVVPKINRINPSKDQEQVDLLMECLFHGKMSVIESYYTTLSILKNNLLGSKVIRNALLRYILNNEGLFFGDDPFFRTKFAISKSPSVELIKFLPKISRIHSMIKEEPCKNKNYLLDCLDDIEKYIQSIPEESRELPPIFVVSEYIGTSRLYISNNFKSLEIFKKLEDMYSFFTFSIYTTVDDRINGNFIHIGSNIDVVREFILTEFQEEHEKKQISGKRKLNSLKIIIKKANIPVQLISLLYRCLDLGSGSSNISPQEVFDDLLSEEIHLYGSHDGQISLANSKYYELGTSKNQVNFTFEDQELVESLHRISYTTEQEFLENLSIYPIYQNYIQGLSACMRFANCASKQTRVDKLYSEFSQDRYMHQFFGRGKAREGINSFYVRCITGSAGSGKSIALQQLALEETSKIERHIDDGTLSVEMLRLPIFLKAKHYSNLGMFLDYEDNITNLVNFSYLSTPNLEHFITREEFKRLLIGWDQIAITHNNVKHIYLDAIDEMNSPQNSIKDLSKWVKLLFSDVIFTSRKGYEKFFQSHNGFDIDLELEINQNELIHEVPDLLCAAWGISDQLAEKYRNLFKQYESVLTHPMYVGWFCFLLLEGKIDDDGNEMYQEERLLRSKPHMLLKKIIESGISKALQRKDSELLNQMDYSVEIFSKKVKAFISLVHHLGNENPGDIFALMEEKFGINCSDIERNSILNDCSLLYMTGMGRIDWTHFTVPEIIYAESVVDSILSGDLDKLYPGAIRYSSQFFLRYTEYYIETMATPEDDGYDLVYKNLEATSIIVESVLNSGKRLDYRICGHRLMANAFSGLTNRKIIHNYTLTPKIEQIALNEKMSDLGVLKGRNIEKTEFLEGYFSNLNPERRIHFNQDAYSKLTNSGYYTKIPAEKLSGLDKILSKLMEIICLQLNHGNGGQNHDYIFAECAVHEIALNSTSFDYNNSLVLSQVSSRYDYLYSKKLMIERAMHRTNFLSDARNLVSFIAFMKEKGENIERKKLLKMIQFNMELNAILFPRYENWVNDGHDWGGSPTSSLIERFFFSTQSQYIYDGEKLPHHISKWESLDFVAELIIEAFWRKIFRDKNWESELEALYNKIVADVRKDSGRHWLNEIYDSFTPSLIEKFSSAEEKDEESKPLTQQIHYGIKDYDSIKEYYSIKWINNDDNYTIWQKGVLLFPLISIKIAHMQDYRPDWNLPMIFGMPMEIENIISTLINENLPFYLVENKEEDY